MKQASKIISVIWVVAMIAAGCSSDKGTSQGPINHQPLAGGGRLADGDPYTGRTDTVGPILPEPWPQQGPMVLFSSDIDCQHRPTQRIIGDSAAWRQWWDSAWACLPQVLPDSNWWHDSTGGGALPPDSVIGDTVFPGDTSYYGSLPYVDFDSAVVVVIALEEDSSFGRMLWVDEVVPSGPGTVVRYTVTRLGDDCMTILMGPAMSLPSSPTIAVLMPRPVAEPVDWVRHDTVWSCFWEPDPDLPVTMYFTDTPCDLGPNEQMITDSAAYRAWIEAATACDSARFWTFFADSGFGGWTQPPFGLQVDFTTHAVIILRAGAQSRWGGGIWLNRLETTGGVTQVDYAVMEPDSDCPPIEGLPEVNPTVAIRVPLPPSATVTWSRSTETIGCLWPDSVGPGVPPDSLR